MLNLPLIALPLPVLLLLLTGAVGFAATGLLALVAAVRVGQPGPRA